MSETHRNLLADGPAPTLLPEDPAARALAAGQPVREVAAAQPTSSLAWAMLAEEQLAGGAENAVTAYAFARTGYHRGLDALRRAGWRGAGPVPWEHQPNQGFLRALAALAQAAAAIGERDEQERCTQFLRDSSETAWQTLLG